MSNPCVIVLTARGPARLLEDGGSQAWRLNAGNAKRFKYCVCVQNRHNGPWGGADQEHHHAFMVGRISDVVPSPERPDRYLIVFSEYARINYPNAWPGLRNPVRYGMLEDFGISDPDPLLWQPMPPATLGKPSKETREEGGDGCGHLTIAEAKTGLALGLGVPESAVEITIRF